MAPATPGWHGKLPSLGDFASRRLDPTFLEFWDAWLADGMEALRASAPGTWLEAYLQGPSWRFLLLPGVLPGALGEQAWAGVLMPSVDRVGRYFPFTVVQPLGVAAALPPLAAVWPWLDRLDELAADALRDDWTVERVEAELVRLPPPAASTTGPAVAETDDDGLPTGVLQAQALAADVDAPGWIALAAQRLWIAHEQGTSFWTAQAEGEAPRLCRVQGLPHAAALATLLGLDSAVGAAPSVATPSDGDAPTLPPRHEDR
ncbi:MAG: type VI secretion system-associated protein TagF [Rubrivivax sp.]